jgi:hypothetical protein
MYPCQLASYARISLERTKECAESEGPSDLDVVYSFLREGALPAWGLIEGNAMPS